MTDVFPCEVTGKAGKAAEVQLFCKGPEEARTAGSRADVTSWWWGAIWFTCQWVDLVPVTCLFLCHSYWTEVCHLTLFLAEWHQQSLLGLLAGLGCGLNELAESLEQHQVQDRLLSPAGDGGHHPLSVLNSCYPIAFLAWHLPADTISWSMKVCEPAAVCLVLSLAMKHFLSDKPMLSWAGDIRELLSVWGSMEDGVSSCNPWLVFWDVCHERFVYVSVTDQVCDFCVI